MQLVYSLLCTYSQLLRHQHLQLLTMYQTSPDDSELQGLHSSVFSKFARYNNP